MNDAITKPIDFEQLKSIVKKAFQSKKTQSTLHSSVGGETQRHKLMKSDMS